MGFEVGGPRTRLSFVQEPGNEAMCVGTQMDPMHINNNNACTHTPCKDKFHCSVVISLPWVGASVCELGAF